MFDVPTSWAASYEPFGMFINAMLTLGVLTILWKENPMYRICEHIYVGATAANGVVTTFANTIKPGITVNMMRNGDWWEILPIVLGLMIYFQPFRNVRWLSRFPMAFTIGYAAGMNLTIRTFMPILTQVKSSMIPWVVNNKGAFSPFDTFTNIVFSVSLLLALVYFIFSFNIGTGTGTGALSVFLMRSARYVFMITFGCSFGATVMSRSSLFQGRAEFLLIDWLGIISR